MDIFEPLSPKEVEALGQEANLRVGEILYAPADRCEPLLFVLKRSRVRLYRETLEGRKFTLAVIENGTIFGEGSLASRRSRNAYAECVVRDPGPLHPPPARDHDRGDEPRGGHARLRAAQGGRADGMPHHTRPGHRSLTKVVRGGRNLSHRVRCHNKGVAGARSIAPGRPNDSQAADGLGIGEDPPPGSRAFAEHCERFGEGPRGWRGPFEHHGFRERRCGCDDGRMVAGSHSGRRELVCRVWGSRDPQPRGDRRGRHLFAEESIGRDGFAVAAPSRVSQPHSKRRQDPLPDRV